MIITLLAAAGLTFCVRAAIRIVDNAGVFALNMADFHASHKDNGSSNVITHNLGELRFNAIEAATAAKVTVRSADGPNRDVILRVSENLAEHVDMEVRKGTLHIGLSNSNKRRLLKNTLFELSVPYQEELESLKAIDAAKITVVSPLRADGIKITATGASEIIATLDCRECEAEATGASKIALTGRCDKLDIEASVGSKTLLTGRYDKLDALASGSSKIEASECEIETCKAEATGASKIVMTGRCRKLEADASGASKIDAAMCETATCKAEASGASKVSVWCTEMLDAEASGASRVEYKGECRVDRDASGASKITRII